MNGDDAILGVPGAPGAPGALGDPAAPDDPGSRPSPGRFITFEGIDGAGKSTHLEALAQRLRARGDEVVLTREPGGTALAEQVREILLHQSSDVLTEALLAFAARRDHVRAVIVPALRAGRTVLCDRFTDATFAYQGAGGAPRSLLAQLETWVHGPLQPNLTLLFDLPAEVAAQRRAATRGGAADRFERRDAAFFERVRDGYRMRLAESPERFVRIDAAAPRDAVWQAIVAALDARGI